jgi:PKD repeat protein
MSTSLRICLLGSLMALSACTVQDTPMPMLSGPSELGLRVSLQISPDSILQDGASQSVIQIDASGPDGRPVRGLALRIEVEFEGIVQDYGTLSAKTIVTGDDGRARVTYTSPPRPSSGSDEANVVVFRVTPIGTEYTGEVGRTATLRLVTPGVILPPNAAPSAAFTWAPDTVGVMTNVVFDASTSTDEGRPCGAACTYSWDFGDGGNASGVFAPHQFRTAGSFPVRLTVTDGRGASHTTTQTVTVGGTPPTAAFTFSPQSPSAGQAIFFNAQTSTAGTGRQIVSYDWDFGSGRTATGVTTTKGYDTPGTYTVTLTVTDDAGQKDTDARAVTVGVNSPLSVALAATPSTATTNQTVLFTATATGAPTSPIVDYRFSFADGTGDVITASPTTTHRFATAGVYGVTVTVRDSANRTATGLATVTITGGGGSGGTPVSNFTFSPTSPSVNQTVFFNGSGSTTPSGTTITSYAWDFGDGTTASVASPTHAYTMPGSFVARLTVTNSAGQTGTSTQTVSVGAPLQARITATPTTGTTTTTFFFDARTSTPGTGTFITSYRFTFGDGTFQDSSSPTATHTFAAAGSYTVTVTIRDNQATPATSTASVVVTVSP